LQSVNASKEDEVNKLAKEIKEIREKFAAIESENEKLQNADKKQKAKITQLRSIASRMKLQLEDLRNELLCLNKKQNKTPTGKADNTKDNQTPKEAVPIERMTSSGIKINIYNPEAAAENQTGSELPKLQLIMEDDQESFVGTPKAKYRTHEDLDSVDSDESFLSEAEFVYYDTVSKVKQKFNFDQLNSNLLAYRPSTHISNVPAQLVEVEKDDMETQTYITLMDSKYDDIFENKVILDDLVTERRLKKEVDLFAGATEKLLSQIESEQKQFEDKLFEKLSLTDLRQRLGSIQIPEPLFGPLRSLTEQMIAQGGNIELINKINDELAQSKENLNKVEETDENIDQMEDSIVTNPNIDENVNAINSQSLRVSQLKSQASDDPIKIEQYMTDSNSPSFKTHDSQTKKSSVIFVLLINV